MASVCCAASPDDILNDALGRSGFRTGIFKILNVVALEAYSRGLVSW